MAWSELAEVLFALVESIQAPPGFGVVVTEAEMDVPLEMGSAWRDGQLVFFGTPPHTRWKSGVLPPVHMGRLRVKLIENGDSN